MQNKINTILFNILIVLIPIAVTVCTYSWSINALANYIYKNTTGQISFLAPTTVQHKLQTGKALHIEYMVLKAPLVKTTAVKK